MAGDDSVYVAGDARHREEGGISFAYAVAHVAAGGGADRSFGRQGVEILPHGTASIAGAALAVPGGILVGGSYQMRSANGETLPTALLLTLFPGS